MDDDLRVRYVSPTIFNNYDAKAPVQDWKIDEYVTDNLRKIISKDTKMAYQVFNYDRDPFLAIYEEGNHNAEVKNELAAISKKNGLDAIFFMQLWGQCKSDIMRRGDI